MTTYKDIYIMMYDAIYEYLHLHGCFKQMFCHKCDHYGYCGIDSIQLAKLMIYDY